MLHLPRLHLHNPAHILRWPLYAPANGLPHVWQRPLVFALAAAGALALMGVLIQAGPFTSLSQAPTGPSAAHISNIVGDYLNRWQPAVDPPVTLSNGLQVKSSNVYGIEIEGERYYYRFTNTYSADPITRGEASEYISITTLDPGTQWEVEVYRLK